MTSDFPIRYPLLDDGKPRPSAPLSVDADSDAPVFAAFRSVSQPGGRTHKVRIYKSRTL